MKPRISVITLAVENLERAVAFYRDGLGLQTNGIIGEEFEHGAVAFFTMEGGAFFTMEGGLRLALWPKESLAHDTGLKMTPSSSLESTIGHNADSKIEVDEVMKAAKNAGARIIKEGQETFWGGYAGYFQDLDGHLWEIVWNPHLQDL